MNAEAALTTPQEPTLSCRPLACRCCAAACIRGRPCAGVPEQNVWLSQCLQHYIKSMQGRQYSHNQLVRWSQCRGAAVGPAASMQQSKLGHSSAGRQTCSPRSLSFSAVRHEGGQALIGRAAADQAHHRLAAGDPAVWPHINHRHRPQLGRLPLAPPPAQHIIDDAHR